MMGRVIFWQNSMSIHQASMISALAEMDGPNVLVVVFDGLSQGRKEMGWSIPDYGRATLVDGMRESAEITSVLAHTNQNDLHIFSGISGFKKIHNVLLRVMRSKAYISIFAESPDPRGVKGLLRRIYYRYLALCYNTRIDSILAAGALGVEWFTRCGFTQQKIFEFGYYFDPPQRDHKRMKERGNKHQFIYVGSLIHRKGVDLLIKAVAQLENTSYQLHIVGDGPENLRLQRLASRLNVQTQLIWHGNCPNEEVQTSIYNADTLILPSRFDGWGAVVNEALLSHTFVIVSTMCGAVSLLQDSKTGRRFTANNVSSLASLLKDRINETSGDNIDQKLSVIPDAQTGALFIKALFSYHVENTPFSTSPLTATSMPSSPEK